jgi:hypothetical protein
MAMVAAFGCLQLRRRNFLAGAECATLNVIMCVLVNVCPSDLQLLIGRIFVLV